jgi:hypothetical protein
MNEVYTHDESRQLANSGMRQYALQTAVDSNAANLFHDEEREVKRAKNYTNKLNNEIKLERTDHNENNSNNNNNNDDDDDDEENDYDNEQANDLNEHDAEMSNDDLNQDSMFSQTRNLNELSPSTVFVKRSNSVSSMLSNVSSTHAHLSNEFHSTTDSKQSKDQVNYKSKLSPRLAVNEYVDSKFERLSNDNPTDESNEELRNFFEDILSEQTPNSNQFESFMCICCHLTFRNNQEFLAHCTSSKLHLNLNLTRDQERFILNNLCVTHNVNKSEEDELNLSKSSSNSANHTVESKIVVILMEKRIKMQFLNENAQDLLAPNEEIAHCLERLNKEQQKSKMRKRKKVSNETESTDNEREEEDEEDWANGYDHDEDDLANENENFQTDNEYDSAYYEYNNNNNWSSNEQAFYSLLFIDISIVKFNRILKIIKNLYFSNDDENKPVYEETIDNDSNESRNVRLAQAKQTTIKYKNENEMQSQINPHSFENEKKNRSSQSSLKAINELIVNKSRTNMKREKYLDKHSSSSPSSSCSATSASKTTSISATVSNGQSKQNNFLPNTNSTSSMHSRNACKKLKCPKCNWHYKYRETLDIHMREKHATDLNNTLEQQCIYCLENAPHPRLGRGEQYKCGYKPYRCDICDYSTTTKGNLSIHMQSDKHINNLKELQSSSNITADVAGSTTLLKADNKSMGHAALSSSSSSSTSSTPPSSSHFVKNLSTITEKLTENQSKSTKGVVSCNNEENENEEVEMENTQVDSNPSKENVFSKIRNTSSTHSSGKCSFQISHLSKLPF